MANLLPEKHRIEVQHERTKRLTIVALIGLFIVTLVASALLMPSLILARSQASESERKVELTRQLISQREQGGVLADVRKTRTQIARLETEIGDIMLSSVLEALERNTPSGITLTDLSYHRQEGVDQMVVNGTATTRNVLLTFTQQLDRDDLFIDVSLPVSNLASSVDIDFSLSFGVLGNDQPEPEPEPEPAPADETEDGT